MDAFTSMTAHLGQKLRARRKALGLTMQHVADEAGLSAGFISQVERDIAAPSLSSLAAIAKALGQPVSFFLTHPSGTGELTRTAERSSFSTGALTYERLSASFPGSKLHAVLVHEPPGHRAETMQHEGEELILVVKGALTVELDGKVEVLTEGDSVHFDSRIRHCTWNPTDEITTVLWCCTMDIFGDGNAPHPTKA